MRGWTRSGPTALELAIRGEDEVPARDLSERETDCCSFFTFDFDPSDDGLVMRIGVPRAHVDVLDAIQTRLAAVAGGFKDDV